MNKINEFISLIEESNSKGLLVDNDILTGFSGEKLIGTLQRLAQQLNPQKECYVEVGVFQGLSLLSVAKAFQNGDVYGIDNFSQFDKDNVNFSIVEEREKKLQLTNVNIINKDFEIALENLDKYIGNKKVGVYFVDGPHDYRSQLMCLLLAKPYLSEHAVILVDDSNYEHVRQANRDFLIANPDFKLLFESYNQTHPHNFSKEKQQEVQKGWWNGINILVHDPYGILPCTFPPTSSDKILFYNQHLNDSSKFPEAIPLALGIMNVLKPLRLLKLINRLRILKKAVDNSEKEHIGDFPRRNTFSKNLSNYNIIKPL